MQAHHRRSLWPGAPPTTMLPGFVPDETTTTGEPPLTKPKVWFDARANKARITYPPGGGPGTPETSQVPSALRGKFARKAAYFSGNVL